MAERKFLERAKRVSAYSLPIIAMAGGAALFLHGQGVWESASQDLSFLVKIFNHDINGLLNGHLTYVNDNNYPIYAHQDIQTMRFATGEIATGGLLFGSGAIGSYAVDHHYHQRDRIKTLEKALEQSSVK